MHLPSPLVRPHIKAVASATARRTLPPIDAPSIGPIYIGFQNKNNAILVDVGRMRAYLLRDKELSRIEFTRKEEDGALCGQDRLFDKKCYIEHKFIIFKEDYRLWAPTTPLIHRSQDLYLYVDKLFLPTNNNDEIADEMLRTYPHLVLHKNI